jgi:hypothetical protein
VPCLGWLCEKVGNRESHVGQGIVTWGSRVVAVSFASLGKWGAKVEEGDASVSK